MFSTRRLVPAGLALAFLAASALADPPLRVSVAPVGPSAAALQAIREGLPSQPALRHLLEGTRFRLLSFQLLDTDPPGNGNGNANGVERLQRYRAVYYDYTHNRAVEAIGTIVPGNGEPLKVAVLSTQPGTNDEEFEAAVLVLRADPELGPKLASGALRAFPPMPPVLEPTEGASAERTVWVGLLPSDPSQPHRIVGVNMIRGTVVAQGPSTSGGAATATACGSPNAGQATTARGTAGQYDVTIARNGAELWRFTVLRPSVSTGTNASGIELRGVTYKGRLVLGRAHVPVMNVKYTSDACGPYRDWQWQEGQFVANGTDVASGIRLASAPPSTIYDTGDDTGNFAGVAYYVGTSDVTFTTELQAGWYRYVMLWRFRDDGTIQPRVEFAGVENGCICNQHTHHAYWRLDFDIGGAANNTIAMRRGGGAFKVQKTETSGKRDKQMSMQWLVQNAGTGNGYRVVPGPNDGVADSFGVADYWLLRGKGSAELDDGLSCVTCSNASIQIGSFANGESIQNQDVVLWYGAQFVHDITASAGPEAVGPDLVPDSW